MLGSTPIDFIALTSDDQLKFFRANLVGVKSERLTLLGGDGNLLAAKKFSDEFLCWTVFGDNFLGLLDRRGNF